MRSYPCNKPIISTTLSSRKFLSTSEQWLSQINTHRAATKIKAFWDLTKHRRRIPKTTKRQTRLITKGSKLLKIIKLLGISIRNFSKPKFYKAILIILITKKMESSLIINPSLNKIKKKENLRIIRHPKMLKPILILRINRKRKACSQIWIFLLLAQIPFKINKKVPATMAAAPIPEQSHDLNTSSY